MAKMFLAILILFVYMVSGTMGNSVPTLYNYPMHISWGGQPCTRSLYENQDVNDDKIYSKLKKEIQEAIANVYHAAYNSTFYMASIKKFFCESENKVLFEFNVALTVKDDARNVSRLLENTTDAMFSHSSDVQIGILKKFIKPTSYNVLETQIVNNVLCKQIHLDTFRNNLANKLIIVDSNGLSTAQGSQIVLAYHECGDKNLRFKNAKLHFFVSEKGKVVTLHHDLTELSYKILKQIIYDGSTWKLGMTLDKKVSDVSMIGGTDPESMSDVEIIYLGIGLVIILLVLIIVIVMLLKCCCGCCRDERKPDKKLADDKYDYAASANNNGTRNGTELQEIKVGENGKTNAAYESREVNVDIDMKSVPQNADKENEASINNSINIESTASEKSLLDEVVEGIKLEQPDTTVLVMDDKPTQESWLKENPDAMMVEVEPVHTEMDVPQYTANHNRFPSMSSTSSSESEVDVDDGDDLDYKALKIMQGDSLSIENEFKGLERRMPTGLIYSDGAAQKNRMPNQFPWPDKRVVLKVIDEIPDSDYINASLIKGFDGNFAYISTQAPLGKTVDDFWRMLWDYNAEIIVMATCVTFRGEEKCVQYWPTDSVKRTIGYLTVQLKTKDLKPDYVVTTLTATDALGISRDVTIYRYMSWPTRDARETPDSVKSVVAFLLEVKEKIEATKAVPVFHGSNSVGMGTVFLAIIQGITRYEAQKHVNIKKMVRLLRKGQAGAVENFEQYKFIYDAVTLYADYVEH